MFSVSFYVLAKFKSNYHLNNTFTVYHFILPLVLFLLFCNGFRM